MITDKQFNKLKVGDWFFAVMQKDNNPFEKPRIIKFLVKEIDNDYPSYPIISIKQDRWGRYYRFKESQIHLTYEDALFEKKQVLEKIKKFEKERKERDEIYFAEQEERKRKEQEAHDNQIRTEERKKMCDFLRQALDIREHHPIVSIKLVSQEWFFHKLLDQIEGASDE